MADTKVKEKGVSDDPLGEVLGDESALDTDDPFGAGLDDMLDADEESARGEILPFDFNRPHNISRKFEQNLQNIFENMAKIGTIYFTNMFRANVVLEYRELGLIGCGEFLGNLPTPTCVATVAVPPLKGYSMVHMEMGLCFAMLKKLMGGDLDSEEKVREFTEIERSIFEGLVMRVMDQFTRASARLVDFAPEFGEIENNPNYLQGINVGDTLVQGEFNFKIDTVEGRLLVNLPMSSFEPVRAIFDPDEERELRSANEVSRDRHQIMDMVQGSGSELIVKLGEIDSSLEKVMALKAGDVLDLAQPVDRPLVVEMADKPLFRGEAGHVHQVRAIRLTEWVSEE